MQKNLPLVIGGIVLVLVVLGGVVGYAAYKKDADAKSASSSSSNSSSNTAFDFAKVNKASDLLGMSASLECEVKDGGKSSIVYIKNGAMTSKSDNTNVILKDSKMMTWEDGKTEGLVIAFDANDLFKDENLSSMSKMSTGATPTVGEDFDTFKKSCKPSVVSDDKFIPPANVKFQDFQAMMKQEMEKAGISEGSYSSYSLPSGLDYGTGN